MTVSAVIEEHLPGLEEFLQELEKSSDSSPGEEYRHVQALIRFAQRFYEDFLKSEFGGIEVTSFSFADKRLVAEKIDQEENRENKAEESTAAQERKVRRLDLAYRYLEICDQLHEDLLFGYSEDVGDYLVFHEETVPDWLDELSAWLEAEEEEGLAKKVEDLVARYRRVT